MKKGIISILLVGIIILAIIGALLWRFGRSFTENTDPSVIVPSKLDQLSAEKGNLIRINYPRSGDTISSPLEVVGTARGNWYFEASFPVIVVDWDGKIIGQGIAQAQGDWMTTDFVPFKGTITFEDPTVYNRGAVIFRKDNPSGDPSRDDALEIPVFFSNVNTE